MEKATTVLLNIILQMAAPINNNDSKYSRLESVHMYGSKQSVGKTSIYYDNEEDGMFSPGCW